MAKVMVTLKGGAQPPTVEEIRRRFNLDLDDIDESFGVVEVDPANHIYTVLIEEHVAERLQPDDDWQFEGPFSNPRIAPFDLAEPAAPLEEDEGIAAEPADTVKPGDTTATPEPDEGADTAKPDDTADTAEIEPGEPEESGC